MSLLRDTSFHAAPLTVAQRACFFAGFLYYLSTAVTFFGGPLAAAVLVWALPQEIWPWRYLPLLAASWCIFAAWKSTLTTRWNLSVLRVQMLYSAAHAMAIWDSLRGRTAAWVPTGSATKGASLSTKISRLARGWLVTIETVILLGVVRGVWEYGIERFWLSAALTGLALIVVAPILRPLRIVVRQAPPIAEASAVAVWLWMSAAMAQLAAMTIMITW
jgi:cellulose synthase (UDP-forming)